VTVAERTATVAGLVAERLGADRVSTEYDARVKNSSDWSKMSPVLEEKVPRGRYVADAVVRPRSPQEVADVLALAHEHDVPVTPRGSGTGNYGQATPFDGGIVLDLRRLDEITVLEDGSIRAGAGALLSRIDRAAREAGRDIWIFPSTKASTVGGFVAGGSAGTGTIERGTTSDGFVLAVTVALMDGSGTLVHARGDAATPYIHAYGVTGILVEVEIATDPAREWLGIYASFDTYEQLVAVHSTLLDLPVLPRLASGDEPRLVPSLPTSVDLDPDRYCLRVIAEVSTADEVEARVVAAGGDVVAVLDDYADCDRISTMSYNHPVLFLQRAHPDRTWFHMETGSRLYWTDPDAVRAVYPGEVHLHLELMKHGPLAMVVADYHDEAGVLAGMAKMEELGVTVHSPHQWYVDRNVDLAVETARTADPKGLLNPGKLVPDNVVPTRVNVGVS
jgi:FAD/FMN-containing dehydrogenase